MTTKLASFLDMVEVNHGPKPELGRYFLETAESFRKLGVTLHMARGFDRLIEVHRQNLSSWHPLVPTLDPSMSDIAEENAIYIEGQVNGEPVATMALRRFDWLDTSLRREWESGRFAYRDPANQMQPQEEWRADAPMAEDITGQAVFCGGIWYRRDYRARGLSPLNIQLAWGLALTTWNADYLFGVMETGALSRALLPGYGYPAVEPGLLVTGGFRTVDVNLVWYPTDDLHARVLNCLSAAPDHARQMDRQNTYIGRSRKKA